MQILHGPDGGGSYACPLYPLVSILRGIDSLPTPTLRMLNSQSSGSLQTAWRLTWVSAGVQVFSGVGIDFFGRFFVESE